MMKKIWIVSELYYPEETSTGYFLTKIAEGLACQFSVCVLCVQPTYAARGAQAPTHEQRNGVKIIRCKATTLNKDNLLYRLINIFTISVSIFIQALRRVNRGDLVIVVTNPPLLPYLIALACILRRTKYFLLIHDVYPEVLIAARMIRKEGLFAKSIGWFTKKLYIRSHRIIVLGRDMKELVSKKMSGQHSGRIVVIPNWADVESIVPQNRVQNPLIKKLDLQLKFIVQYSGNMGRTHGLETIVETASKMRSHTSIHFLLCGSGAKLSWLHSIVKHENLANVTILSRQPMAELKNLLNACDISIIPLISGMSGVSVPSRMYNILAAGKPIVALADLNSELASVIQEEKIGWVIPPNQPEMLGQTILTARANLEDLRIKGEKARVVAEKKYTLNRVINAYSSLIDECERDH